MCRPLVNLRFASDSPLDRADLSYPPVIGSLQALGPAADFLAPGDRIHQIDCISTIGLTNEHVLNVLCHGTGAVAVLEIEYSLPDYCEYIQTRMLFSHYSATFRLVLHYYY